MELLSKLYPGICEAHRELRPLVPATPLQWSPLLSDALGAQVYLKCEHVQVTGSFKYRGASNKIRLLDAAAAQEGVITASTGNHGQGLALAGRQGGVPVTVFAPRTASAAKLKKIELYGASVELVAGDALASELRASATARARGITYVSPYNDLDVIAGQGTVGMEIAEQLPGVDAVFVAVGGGGLFSGLGCALRQVRPGTELVGCWPEAAHSMHASLQAGEIVQVEESATLSDGTAGGVEPGAITFDLCRALIDRQVLVSEIEIAEAMRRLARDEHWIVEGAAGVALAGFIKVHRDYRNKQEAVVLCGRNITLEKYQRVLEGGAD